MEGLNLWQHDQWILGMDHNQPHILSGSILPGESFTAFLDTQSAGLPSSLLFAASAFFFFFRAYLLLNDLVQMAVFLLIFLFGHLHLLNLCYDCS